MSNPGSSLSSPAQKHTQVRQTWRAFELWLQQRQSNTLQPQFVQSDSEAAKDWKKLTITERAGKTQKSFKAQRRLAVEETFYASAREEWQRRLGQAGLRDEDWGDMTDAETRAVESALGAHLDADAAHQTSSAGNLAEPSSMALLMAPTIVALAPPKMAAPSLSTSSVASSISSYELVNPSELGSDDDAEEDGARFFSVLASSHDLTSEDDDLSILSNPSWKTFEHLNVPAARTHSSSSSAHHYQTSLSHTPNWSADSSRHNSASCSPTHSSFKSFPFDTSPAPRGLFDDAPVPPNARNAFGLPPSTSSSSQMSFKTESAAVSAAKPKLVHSISSSSSYSSSAAVNAVWTPPSSGAGATIPLSNGSSSASASATGSGKPKFSPPASISQSTSSSTSSSISTTSTKASSYIGPILLDEDFDKEGLGFDTQFGGNDPAYLAAGYAVGEYPGGAGGGDSLEDMEEAENEALSFERFKLETRITKIIEFHRIAAEMEIKLGLGICKLKQRQATWAKERERELQAVVAVVPKEEKKKNGKGKDKLKDSAKDAKLNSQKDIEKEREVRDEEQRLVVEHEKAMKELQAQKEEERRTTIKEERRRRALLMQRKLGGRAAHSTSLVLGGKSKDGEDEEEKEGWLDEYDNMQAVFEVDVPSLDGVFGSAGSKSVYERHSSGQQKQKPLPPGSPDVKIAKPQPKTAWGQIPFMNQGEEESSEYGGEVGYSYEPENERGGYGHQYEQPQHHHYDPRRQGVQHSQQSQYGSQAQYQQQQSQRIATFQPRHDREDEQHGFGEEMPEEIMRAMSGFGLDGYGSSSPAGGCGPGSTRYSPQHNGGYSSSSELKPSGYRSNADATRYSPHHGSGAAYGSDSQYGPSGDAMRGYGSDSMSGYHGSGSNIDLGGGYASDAHRHSMGGMPGGMSTIGYSPVDVSTPRVAQSTHSQSHAWGSGSTPTKTSSLGPRGLFGGNTQEQQQQEQGYGQPSQPQQQQQQQQPVLSAWGRKNSAASTVTSASTTQLPSYPSGPSLLNAHLDSTLNTNPNPNDLNTNGNSTPSIASGLTSGVGAWAKKISSFGGILSSSSPAAPAPASGVTTSASPSSYSSLTQNRTQRNGQGLGQGQGQREIGYGSGSRGRGGFFDEDEFAQEDELAEEDEEEQEDEEEEEEEAPLPPPPVPAPVAKGNKGKNAVSAPPPVPPPVQVGKKKKGSAKKGGVVISPAVPSPPPPVVEKPKPEPVVAHVPPVKEAPVKKGKKGKQTAVKKGAKAVAADPEPELSPVPPAPVPPQPAPSKASGKKGSKAVESKPEESVDPALDDIEDEDADEQGGGLFGGKTSLTSKMGGWGSMPGGMSGGIGHDTSSTPRPPAAKPGWGLKPDTSGTPKPSQATLRKQMHQQQQRRDNDDPPTLLSGSVASARGLGKVNGGRGSPGVSTTDASPLPAAVTESLWARVSTPVSNGTGRTPSVSSLGAGAPAKAGWKTSAPSRLGSSVFDGGDNEKGRESSSIPSSVSNRHASATNGGTTSNGNGRVVSTAANGGVKKKAAKKVTIEEVSDEEDGVLDNSLPLTYRSIMEPKSPDPNGRSISPRVVPSSFNNHSGGQSALMPQVRQPQPSVPPTVFSNLFDYQNNVQPGSFGQRNGQGSGRRRTGEDERDRFFSSNSMTPSAVPTSPEDITEFSEEWLKEAAKQLNGGRGSSGPTAPRTIDQEFNTDWEGTVKAKRGGKWGTGPSNTGSSSSSSAFGMGGGRFKDTMPGAMNEDEMGLGGIPGSLNLRSGSGATAPSMWEAKQQQLQQQQQQQGKAKASSLSSSAWGTSGSAGGSTGPTSVGQQVGGHDGEDLFARFAQSQQLEAMRRKNANGAGGKLF